MHVSCLFNLRQTQIHIEEFLWRSPGMLILLSNEELIHVSMNEIQLEILSILLLHLGTQLND